ncbi:sulfatase-like hydrolase/transferase [Candidatus Saccharibacteria bacterium]|nr:sulfatase-like hydrolase/transferase [Candidatus Saccharibacteria bacterium]MBR3253419.1 sulfatase-like hydrolase/transferase [Candidatus Saccharibacteria bacterium]
MKQITKLLSAIVFSFIVAFALFIYEPLVMYAGNIDEFWFDSSVVFQNNIPVFLAAFTILAFISVVLFIIFCKKIRVFCVLEVIAFSGFIYLYIHGNFLTNMLPTLYGDKIDWSSYVSGHVISIVLLLVLVALLWVGFKKLKAIKLANYSFFVMLAFFVMMLASFGVTLATPGLFVNKAVQPVVTAKGINDLSKNKNFYILLVDCTDSLDFNEYIEEKYSDDFKDFVYFSNSAPGYSLTRDSIPLIFTGEYNRNEKQFNTFSTEAFDDSDFFETLKENNYEMAFYSNDIVWNSRKSLVFANFNNDTKNWSKTAFLKQETKYILFKYLPFPLKMFSRIETMDFNSALRYENSGELYDWTNKAYYNSALTKDANMIDKKLFQFVHVEGAHSPYDMDEELNDIEGGTYSDKVGAAAKMADLAIKRMKKANVYDDSVIIIMSDHGWFSRDAVLYIKGFDETHTQTKETDRPVSWGDLSEVFIKLLDGKTAREAFEGIPEDNRERYYYVNPYYDKKPMVEWTVGDDDCSDSDNWTKTGVEYAYPN